MDFKLSFLTQHLKELKNPFELLLKTVKNDKVDYHTEVIADKAIMTRYKNGAYNLIAEHFEFKTFQKFIAKHRENHETLNLSTPIGEYLQQYYFKYIFDTFQSIKRQQWSCNLTVKHKYRSGTITNKPMTIQFVDPVLRFEIVQDEDGSYHINKFILIDGMEYGEEDVEWVSFIILLDNAIYILSNTDFQTIQRLQNISLSQYRYQPLPFVNDILIDLERKYSVETHGLFPKEYVHTNPELHIFLTESGNFLMIHPKFNYDDILIEGNYLPQYMTYKNGVKYIVQREKESEAQFLASIQSYHPTFQNQQNGYFFITISDAKSKNWFLKFYHALLEQNIAISGMDMLRNFRYSAHPITTDYDMMALDGNNLKIRLMVRFGSEIIANTELQKALKAKQKHVLLKDNTIGVLTDEWLEKFGLLLKHSAIHQDELSVPKWIVIFNKSLFQHLTDSQEPIIDENWWEQWIQWQQTEETLYPLPSSIHATLRPYQQKGYEWMILLSKIGAGACLADDMGLGKTLQTICFLNYKNTIHPDQRQLIVCPSSLMYNWKMEIEKFAPHLHAAIFHSSHRDINALAESNPDIIITSYGTARADIELLEGILWSTIVLDESHHIKNIQAQVTRAVLRLSAQSKVILSGTPILNNTMDLFPQLSFIVPQLFGNAEFFVKEYAHPIDRDRDADKIEQLKRMTAPFILRRTKEQVAKDLPNKTESIIWCEMTSKQKRYYHEVKNNIRQSLFVDIQNQGLQKSKMNVLAGIQRLRQLCSAPVPLEDYDCVTDESIKIDYLIDEVSNNLSDNKVIVFSQFLNSLGKICEKLTEHGIPYYLIDGSTPQEKRQEQINQFQSKDNPVRIFLLSLKAGNSGFTLTEANYVFLIDPWWNRQVENQAIDRVYRIGQEKNVFAYRMICKDTIEERIIQLQQRKQTLSESLIQEDEGFVKNLDEHDIEFLFA